MPTMAVWRGAATPPQKKIDGRPLVHRYAIIGATGSEVMDQNNRFEIPKELRSMAEASFDQARKAFETFLSSAQQAASSLEGRNEAVRVGAKDLSVKAISFAEKNVASSL